MKKYFLPLIALLLVACNAEPEIVDLRTEEERVQESENVSTEVTPSTLPQIDGAEKVAFPSTSPTSNYSYKLVEGDHGWGYQIFEDSTMQINQMHIPSVPGINGFETKEKAGIAAGYILGQIEKGIFPPTVSPAILDSIGAL